MLFFKRVLIFLLIIVFVDSQTTKSVSTTGKWDLEIVENASYSYRQVGIKRFTTKVPQQYKEIEEKSKIQLIQDLFRDELREISKNEKKKRIFKALDRFVIDIKDLGNKPFLQQIYKNIAYKMQRKYSNNSGLTLIPQQGKNNETKNVIGGLQEIGKTTNEDDILKQPMLAAVKLPDELQKLDIQFAFVDSIDPNDTSPIVNIVAGNQSKTDLKYPIKLFFRRNISEQPYSGQCVSWMSELGDGQWDNVGCYYRRGEMLKTEDEFCSDIVIDECWCYHLTNFAQLFIDHNVIVFQHKVLDVISNIGAIISLTAITIIFLTVIMFPRLLKEPAEVKIDGYWRIVMGVLIHTIILCNFASLLSAAITLYRRLVLVFVKDTSIKIKYLHIFINFVFPIIPPLIILIIGYDSYCFPPFFLPRGLLFYLTLVTPLAIVMIANLYVFIRIYLTLKVADNLRRERSVAEDSSTVRLKQLVFLFVILGLSWSFAIGQLFLKVPYVFIFSYAFCISLSVQGISYFIFFVYSDISVKDAWRKFLIRKLVKDKNKPIEVKKEKTPSDEIALERYTPFNTVQTELE